MFTPIPILSLLLLLNYRFIRKHYRKVYLCYPEMLAINVYMLHMLPITTHYKTKKSNILLI